MKFPLLMQILIGLLALLSCVFIVLALYHADYILLIIAGLLCLVCMLLKIQR